MKSEAASAVFVWVLRSISLKNHTNQALLDIKEIAVFAIVSFARAPSKSRLAAKEPSPSHSAKRVERGGSRKAAQGELISKRCDAGLGAA